MIRSSVSGERKSPALVTDTETWDERHCTDSYGYGTGSTNWGAEVRSPLNWYREAGSQWVNADEPGPAEAVCPVQPGADAPEP